MKIHATVDALGNPTGFHLTPGQAHDLEGADTLLALRGNGDGFFRTGRMPETVRVQIES